MKIRVQEEIREILIICKHSDGRKTMIILNHTRSELSNCLFSPKCDDTVPKFITASDFLSIIYLISLGTEESRINQN